MARIPGPDGRHHPLDVLIAEPAERRDGRLRHALIAPEVELVAGIADALRQFRDTLEHLGIVRAYAAEMPSSDGCERVGIRIAHEGRETRELGRAFRERVGLPIGDHLQPVLDRAQEDVGFGELVGGPLGEVPGLGQQPQRAERRRIAQRRLAAAPDQFEGLRQELDLADAAFAELEVVAEHAGGGVRSGRRGRAPPLCASMRCFMATMSATAAKSRPRRQMNGLISARNAEPRARSPATGRALDIAARSQFSPMLS